MNKTTPKKTDKKKTTVCHHPLTDAQELQRAIDALASVGFKDFVRYMQSPRKIMITSFFSGIFRGLGILVGMTIVVSFLIWILSNFVDFPLIGKYFGNLLEYIETLSPQATRTPNNAPLF